MTSARSSFDPAVMVELVRCLPTHARTEAVVQKLQERLRALAVHYRDLISSVPSDLPGAPLSHMTLTRRHEWVDTHILNPIERIKEGLADENRPLLSTWPEFMGTPPEIDVAALKTELNRLESLGKYLWMSARIRRYANVPVGWEIKREIVSEVATMLAELVPELKPSRGTYDKARKCYVGRFPEAITLAYREITGFSDDGVDRQIADFVEEYRNPSRA